MRFNSAQMTRPERGIALTVLLLCCFGMVMVYSSTAVLAVAEGRSSAHYFESQLVKLLLGCVLLATFWLIGYEWMRKRWVAWAALGLGLFSLLLLKLHIGVAPGVRADRWLYLFGMTIQPSEFARIGLVVFMAFYLREDEGRHGLQKSFLLPAGAAVVVTMLVASQPSLSMAVLILALTLGVLYSAGFPIRWMAAAGIPAIAAAVVFMEDYQRLRVLGFLGLAPSAVNYQVDQGMTAVGSGGLFGLGPGNGLQKYFFLPFPHTDFILGIVGEETGFMGIFLVFATYAALIHCGLTAARRAPDRFGSLLAVGLTWNLALNVLVHAVVNLGLGPVTGVPLPFFSFGGSSLLANMLAMGMLLAVARKSAPARAKGWSSVRSWAT
jgi:cell division protein FtsW